MSKNGIDRRHSKWPLGLRVMVATDHGYIEGKINKHDRTLPNGAWVEFQTPLTMRFATGGTLKLRQRCQCCLPFPGEAWPRYCHIIPFRNIKPLPGQARNVVPWYKKGERYELA